MNPKRYFFLTYIYSISFIFILSPIAQAADIQAELDSSNGSSGLSIQNSSATEKARVDSNGNLTAYGNVGVGTTNIYSSALNVGSTSQFNVSLTGTVTTTGNVGISSTAPGQKLDVQGTTRTTNLTMSGQTPVSGYVLTASDSGGDATWSTAGSVAAASGWTQTGTNVYTTGNNVGLGTTTPQAGIAVINGNVGIGTWTAANQLSVAGSVAIGSTTYANTTAPSNALIVSGNVSIATTTSSAKLNIDMVNGLNVLGSQTNSAISINGAGTIGSYAQIGFGAYAPSGYTYAPTAIGFVDVNQVGSNYGDLVFATRSVNTDTAPTERVRITNGGNVGIGSTNPGQTLDVQGTVRGTGLTMSGQTPVSGYVLTASDSGGDATWSTPGGVAGWTISGNNVYETNSGNVGIGTQTFNSALNVLGGAAFGSYATTAAPVGGIIISGNVGIGSSAPGQVLDVNGTIRTTTTGGVTFGTDNKAIIQPSATTTPDMKFLTNNAEIMRITNAGNVGIGSTNPGQKLDVQGTVRGTGLTMSGQTPVSGYVLTASDSGGDATWSSAASVPAAGWTHATGIIYNTTQTDNVGLGTTTPQGSLVVTNGNVGIGTWAPIQPLHVAGHCVTGDTLIMVLRNKVEGGRWKVEGKKEYVRIDSLRPGDYAYSFNEQTQTLETHPIQALFDMGLQPVFELTTQSGRKIQTTGNHPFLVEGRRSKVEGDGQDREAIAQRRLTALQTQGVNIADLSEDKEFAAPVVMWRSMFEKGKENANLSGPKNKHPLDKTGFGLGNFGLQNGLNLRQPFFKTFLGNLQGGLMGAGFDFFKHVRQGAGAFVGQAVVEDFRDGNNGHNGLLDAIKHNICLFDCQSAYAGNVPMPVWVKVLYLQPGDKIAVLDQGAVRWEAVASIAYLGKRRVYDIQVRGTHNFVAGHYRSKETGKVLTQAQEETYAMWKSQQGGINASAYACSVQCNKESATQLSMSKKQQGHQSFFVSIRMNHNSYNNSSYVRYPNINGVFNETYACGFDDQSKTKCRSWQALRESRLSLPLLFSFFGNNVNTDEKEYESEYNKSDTQGQGKFFEEIAGECNGKNRLAHVPEIFRDKFPGFFIENNHESLLFEGHYIEENTNIILINSQKFISTYGFDPRDVEFAGKEKGQGEFHPALPSDSLMDRQSSVERPTIAYHVKTFLSRTGTHKSLLSAFMCPISAPLAGFEPASGLSTKDCFIQLSYRGGPSLDNEATTFDKLSNYNDHVKQFISNYGFDPRNNELEGGRWKVEGEAFASTFDLRPSTFNGHAVFERVARIELLPAEQVWDIQIANTRNFVAGHYINKETGRVLSQAQEDAYAAWKAQQEGINESVCDARCKQQSSQILEWPQQSQWKQSFFISSVGMNKNTDSHKNKTQDSNNDALSDGQTWEKITDQAGYENSFSDIVKGLGNEFNFTVAHRDKAYHIEKGLSTLSYGVIARRPVDFISADEAISNFIATNGFDPRDVEFAGIIAHNTYITGNLGLSVSAPINKLEVSGAAAIGANYAGVYTAPANGLTVQGNVGIGTSMTSATASLAVIGGNVGLGTITPQGALVVTNGNVGIGTWAPGGALSVMNGNVGIGVTSPTKLLSLQSGEPSITLTSTTAGNVQYQLTSGGGLGFTTGDFVIYNASYTGVPFRIVKDTTGLNANALVISSGNVGLGTTSPGSNLSVLGGASFGSYATNAAPAGGIIASGNVGIGTTSPANTQGLSVLGALSVGSYATTGAPAGGIIASGNVGIGSTNPGQKLDVQGTVRGTGLTMSGQTPVSGYVLTASDSGGDATWSSAASVPAAGWTHATGIIYNTTQTDNVGLGTTTPQGSLVVTNGNVGIGTWAPIQPLHVAGHCVTGDTLLSVVKNRGHSVVVAVMRIDHVKGGERVLSLDESTGRIVPARIKGLLNMGIKPIFRLMTASGRSIRTTGNHPYLTKNGWVRVADLKPGVMIAVPRPGVLSVPVSVLSRINALNNDVRPLKVKTNAVFTDPEPVSGWGEIDERFGEGKRTSGFDVNLDFIGDPLLQLGREFPEIPMAAGRKFYFSCHGTAFQVSPNWRLIVSNGIRPFLSASLMSFFNFDTNFGLMGSLDSMASMIQPSGLWWMYSLADAFSSNLASAAQSRSHNEYVSKIKYFGSPCLSTMTPPLKSLTVRPDLASGMGPRANFSRLSSLTRVLGGKASKNLGFMTASPGNHQKYNTIFSLLSSVLLSEAKAAPMPSPALSGDVMWDAIVSIEILPSEQVWDIEVEGTHNFVGNDIIAHNTYITGNLGLSVSAPINKLEVSGAAAIGANYAGVYTAPANGLTVQGNVGIGTSMTSATASLAVIGGNVGLGTTTPQGSLVVTNGNVGIGTWAPSAPLYVNGPTTGVGEIVNGQIQLSSNRGNLSPLEIIDTGASGHSFTVGTITGAGTFDIRDLTASGAPTRLTIDANGNLGIGTTSPANTQGLSVLGALSVGSYATTAAPAGGIIVSGNVGIGTTLPSGLLEVGAQKFDVLSGGNVGIGSTNPGQKLDVQGTVRGTGLTMSGQTPVSGYVLTASDSGGDATWSSAASVPAAGWTHATGIIYNTTQTDNVGLGTTTPQGSLVVTNGNVGIGTWAPTNALQVGTNTLVVNTSAGNVGIGTTVAAFKLTVADANIPLTTANSGNMYLYTTDSMAVDKGFSIMLGGSVSGTIPWGYGSISGRKENSTDSNSNGYLAFATSQAGVGTTEKMRITASGNVGIGVVPTNNFVIQASGVAVNFITTNNTNSNYLSFVPAGAQSSSNVSWNQGNYGGTNDFRFWSYNGLANNYIFNIPDSGNVGISTILPSGLLEVGNQKFDVLSGGNVGIGSITPGKTLDVNGTVRTTNLTMSGQTPVSGYVLTASDSAGDATWSSAASVPAAGWTHATGIIYNTTQTDNVGLGTTTPQGSLVVTNGNVGIGTWAPATLLSVGGGTPTSAANGLNFGSDTSANLYRISAGRIKTDGALTVAGVSSFGDTMTFGDGSIISFGTGPGAGNTSMVIKAPSSESVFIGANGTYTSGILVQPTGNVGIGTTTPQGGFVVTNGNVGIGTWAPIQPLHVNGHCVTGDTRLRRRRRRKKVGGGRWKVEGDDGDAGTNDSDYIYDECRIDAIESGDEILSLNEETGLLEYQKVEALMDMGVKPIYKLTTASGKTIRTTGNHPYLVRVELPRWKMGSLFTEEKTYFDGKYDLCNPEEKHPAHKAGFKLIQGLIQAWSVCLHKINVPVYAGDFVDNGLSTRKFQPAQLSQLKQQRLQSFFASIFGRLQEISNQKTNHNTDTQANTDINRHLNKEITGQPDTDDSFGNICKELREKFLFGFIKKSHQNQAYHSRNGLSNAPEETSLWVRAEEIRAGDYIAVAEGCSGKVEGGRWKVEGEAFASTFDLRPSTSNGHAVFERVAKIELLPAEQVWDIQIANTRNFVAGHYINKETGRVLSQAQEEAYYRWKVEGGRWKEKKRQDEIHPALSSDSLMDKLPSHLIENITLSDHNVNNKKQKYGQPLSCLDRISFRRPERDSNPHFPLSERGALSRLSYPGVLSLIDNEKIIFDNLSNDDNPVKQFISEYGFDPRQVEFAGIIAHNTYITGNLGLSVSAPINKLEVSGAAAIGAGYAGVYTAPANGLTVQGNVGIGTTLPAAALEVNSGTGAHLVLQRTSAYSGQQFIDFRNSSGSELAFLGYGGGTEALNLYNEENNVLTFGTNSSERMRIDNTGNVGIGTTTPYNPLSVVGSAAIGSAAYAGTAGPTNGLIVSGNVGIGTTTPQGVFVINTAGNGNVGIGTWAPTRFVEVMRSGSFSGIRYTDAASDGKTWEAGNRENVAGDFAIQSISNNATRLEILDSGNVGIGSTNPGQKLDVQGTVRGTGLTMSGQTPVSGYVLTASDSGGDATWSSAASVPAAGWTHGTGIIYNTVQTDNVGLGTTTPQGSLVVTNGNVGIGTWTAASPLSVVGGAAIGSTAYANTTAPSNGLIVSGNVGIGTTVPADQATYGGVVLDVAGPGYFRQSNDSTKYVSIGESGGIGYIEANGTANSLNIWTQGNHGILINTSGSVGIGTTNPSSRFHIVGPSLTENQEPTYGLWVANTNAPTKAIILGYDTTNDVGVINAVQQAINWKNIVMQTNGGNVGIGTTLPASPLDILSASGNNGSIVLLDSAYSNGGYEAYKDFSGTAATRGFVGYGAALFSGVFDNTYFGLRSQSSLVFVSNAASSNKYMVMDTNGNVGIGTFNPFGGGLIVTNGNVGIGSTNPGQKLDVQGTVRGTGLTMSGQTPVSGYVLTASNSSGDATWSSAASVPAAGWTHGTGVIYNTTGSDNVGIGTSTPQGGLVVTNGNVGIGTWTAAANLDVVGATFGNVFILRDAISGNAGLVVKPRAAGYGAEVQGTNQQLTAVAPLSLNPEGGNVGIGTISPTNNFTVSGTNVGGLVAINNRPTSLNGLILSYTSTGGIIGPYASGEDLDFQGGNSSGYNNKDMILTYNGNLGIGTSSPGSLLSVNGGASFGSYATTAAPVGGIIASGNVGIGSTNPGQLLDVFGNARLANSGNLTVSGLVSCAGVQTSAAGLMSCTSDARLKDIQGGFDQGLAAIAEIHPQTYSWKKGTYLYDGGVRYSGFIAQDVEKAIPEAVNIGAKGYKQVSTTPILAAAVNAIKELDKKVRALEAQNGSLTARDKAFEERLEALEKRR